MSPSGLCEKCGEPDFFPHTCPPAWNVWRSDALDDEPTQVRAFSAIWAADVWAEQDDSNSEYEIACGNPVTVRVQLADAKPDTPFQWFEVCGEYEPNYTSNEIEDPTK